MKDNLERALVEDLLPLYAEGLLREETNTWLEERLQSSEEYSKLAELAKTPILPQDPSPPPAYGKMVKKIHRTVSLFQILLISISSLLALNSSFLNGSFEFVLWYAVLGCLTYLFYRDMRIVFFISFIPIVIWSMSGQIQAYLSGQINETSLLFTAYALGGTILAAFIHYIFAGIGGLIGLCLVKLRERE